MRYNVKVFFPASTPSKDTGPHRYSEAPGDAPVALSGARLVGPRLPHQSQAWGRHSNKGGGELRPGPGSRARSIPAAIWERRARVPGQNGRDSLRFIKSLSVPGGGNRRFDHRIDGSWLWSRSGSRNKSKSTEPPSSPGLSIHPRATAGNPAAADSTCGSGGSAGRALDSNAPQPSPAKPLRARAQSPNPLSGDRSRGPGDERRAIAGRETVSTSAPPRRAFSSELGAGQAGSGREGAGGQ